ncbi:hypothetical protein V6M85_05560 [Sulfolobus tengchongensis]|uniref:Uncharacterized protein n=1 Tax=Sulfolobus tengchongensis TaxID=207809 RepID=A0AAX4L3I6_9CREN
MSSLVKSLVIINLLLSITLSQFFVIPVVILSLKFILSSTKRD